MKSSKKSRLARQRLLARAEELRADIGRELAKQDEEHYSDLAGQITDAGQESVANLLVDLNFAEISRDVDELRDVEAALERVATGTYGVCIDCDAPIDDDRLDAVPAASRCFSCQVAFENADRREHHRSI